MPTLASSNRSQLAYKLEGAYPTNYGVLQGGNGTNLNILSETLAYDIKNESSKSIRSDGQVPSVVQVGASAQGGIAIESQYREYDPFLQTVMKDVYTVFGVDGVGTPGTGTLTPTSSTVLTASVATSGNSIFTALNKGQWFGITPAAGASAAVVAYLKGRAFRVSASVAPSATVLTLDASTPVDTAIITAALAVGWIVSSSRLMNGTTPAQMATMKSYSLEVGHSDVSLFRQYLGMMASKYDVKLSIGSIVTGSFDFMGKSMVNPMPVVTGMGTAINSQTFVPPNATRGVFDIFEGGVKLSQTTYIKSGEFTIDNGLRTQDAVGVFGSAGLATGSFKATGKLEVYFADAVFYNKFLAGSASSLSIPLLDVDGNGYVYTFPNIKYTTAKVQVGGLDQDNMLSVDWEASLDPDPTSSTYNKTVAIYRVGA